MKIKSLGLILVSAGLVGCAHTTEKTLDLKVSQTPVKTSAELQKEGEMAVENAQGLTPEQKTQIKSLWGKTRGQMDDLREESLKLRSLMMTDLLSPQYNPKEVDLVKRKISDTEHERIAVYFKAIRQTNRLLGRWGSEEERLRFYHLMDDYTEQR